MQTAWIVSSGRTGTQFLARYLDRNFEGVVARHEPPPRAATRIVSNAYAAGALSRGAALALLRRKKRRAVDPLEGRLYVESNPFLWGLVGLLPEVFESPVIVHIVRDPREQARSSLNHGTGRGVKAVANRYLPYWSPRVAGAVPAAERADWLARVAAQWAEVNRAVREAVAGAPGYHAVRYEDLFDERHSGLRALCELLGLDPSTATGSLGEDERLNRGALDVLPRWPEWSGEQCARLHGICSPLMEEYGYGREPEWQSRVGAAA